MATIGELMLLWDIRDELKRANDLVEEERVRREWEKWDREYKDGAIRDLRNHEQGFSILESKGERLYPDISQDMEADLLEKGEVRLVVFSNVRSFIWVDGNRKEAQDPKYLELQKRLREFLTQNNETVRII